jgi:RNA dependent RNA polymerase
VKAHEDEQSPANCRYAARLAQCFSATSDTIELAAGAIADIPEVLGPGGELFSDGVGVITSESMAAVTAALPRRLRERLRGVNLAAIQVRVGGAKGVLARWDGHKCAHPSPCLLRFLHTCTDCLHACELASAQPVRPGMHACRHSEVTACRLCSLVNVKCAVVCREMPAGALVGLRPSMQKFESASRWLEVCEVARALPCHINRQIMVVLLSIGISAGVFWDMYCRHVRQLDHLLHGGAAALQTLQILGAMHDGERATATASLTACMLAAGVHPSQDSLLHALVQAHRGAALQAIQVGFGHFTSQCLQFPKCVFGSPPR